MPSQFSANINLMVGAALKAGRGLIRDFGEVEKLQVSVKGPGDFVSRADIRAEAILREELRSGRPNYGWCAEESAPEAGKDPTRRWIVDPLDGTTNFLHGLPFWAISIALEHKGEVVAGVVFVPPTNELFVAEKGGGAWLNDNRIRVSARTRIGSMLFATSLPAAVKPGWTSTAATLEQCLPVSAGVRTLGAAALNLASVAAGRIDGYWETGLNAWDIAAGLLLVREAGGLVSSAEPRGDPLLDGSIIAASHSAYERLSSLVRNNH